MIKQFLLVFIIISFEGLNASDYKIQSNSSRIRSGSVRRRFSINIGVDYKSTMEAHGVVPDVIDVAPSVKALVRYSNGVDVNYGNEFTPFSVKDEPTVKWPAEEGQYYTLVMTDPDAPSRKEPIWGEVKHWLVVNIPGYNVKKGETLAAYRGSGPPEGSGLHRYIFLIYKQSGLLKHSETPVDSNSREGRMKFKVREFAKKYNLGEPYAGNFYQAQSDDYSKALWAKRQEMEKLKSSMEENGVVSDIIDVAPAEKIELEYSSGVQVNLGNEVTPLSTKDEPSVKWPVENGQFYTFLMIDSDVPNRTEPTLGAVNHWLVVNIPGADISKGEILAPHIGPAPPEGTGLHRYTFLVYKQPGFLKHSETPVDPNNNETRMRFKVRDFAKKYNLGQPYAGNFFQAQSDEYARALWAEWTRKV